MISILCPTRGRPAQLQRMIASARITANDFEVVCYVDEDDRASLDAVQGLAWQLGSPASSGHTYAVVGPRTTLSDCWNRALAKASGDILMQGNDDIIFHTPNWDKLVTDAFALYPDRIVMVHGCDGSHYPSGSGGFAVHPFLHRRWVETVGYFTPPYFSSDYGDTWINDLANSIGRRHYLPDLFIEHLHPSLGKSEVDQTTADRLRRHSADNPAALYDRLGSRREADAALLRAAIAQGIPITGARICY